MFRLFLIIGFCLCLPVSAVLAKPNKPDDLIHFSNKSEDVLIVKVIASDVILLEDGRRIKLIGIQSAGLPPRKMVEYDSKGNIIEEKVDVTIPLEEQAIAYAQNLLEGKKVKLEFDVESLENGRQLAYVFLPDGTLANAELLRQGFVYLKLRPPNVKYQDALRSAYQEAKREQRGFLQD